MRSSSERRVAIGSGRVVGRGVTSGGLTGLVNVHTLWRRVRYGKEKSAPIVCALIGKCRQ